MFSANGGALVWVLRHPLAGRTYDGMGGEKKRFGFNPVKYLTKSVAGRALTPDTVSRSLSSLQMVGDTWFFFSVFFFYNICYSPELLHLTPSLHSNPIRFGLIVETSDNSSSERLRSCRSELWFQRRRFYFHFLTLLFTVSKRVLCNRL